MGILIRSIDLRVCRKLPRHVSLVGVKASRQTHYRNYTCFNIFQPLVCGALFMGILVCMSVVINLGERAIFFRSFFLSFCNTMNPPLYMGILDSGLASEDSNQHGVRYSRSWFSWSIRGRALRFWWADQGEAEMELNPFLTIFVQPFVKIRPLSLCHTCHEGEHTLWLTRQMWNTRISSRTCWVEFLVVCGYEKGFLYSLDGLLRVCNLRNNFY